MKNLLPYSYRVKVGFKLMTVEALAHDSCRIKIEAFAFLDWEEGEKSECHLFLINGRIGLSLTVVERNPRLIESNHLQIDDDCEQGSLEGPIFLI